MSDLDEAYQKAAEAFEWFKMLKRPIAIPGRRKLARVDGKAVFE